MTEAAQKVTVQSVVDDLRSLLAESSPSVESTDEVSVVEAAVVDEATDDGGKSLERKSRERRQKTGGGHNPFKRKSTIGPADARPPVSHPRTNKKTGKWKCKCANYKCMCIAGKRKKVVRIARDYKKSYNKSYKAWRSKQRGRGTANG